ncbi:MAG: hypothetical protein GU348_00785 [Thermogladius sp.]|jgi:hypothetical protein|nr:hypothetical protein [Thermogladius sp.]
MSGEESIVRAALVRVVDRSLRPLAYGLVSLFFGLAWMVGGFTALYLAGISPALIVLFSLLSNAASATLLTHLSHL